MTGRVPLDGTVLITGASSGIGEALARRLAARSRRLIVVARRAERLDALARSLRADHPALQVDTRPCDLADRTARVGLLDVLDAGPPVDVLINNAGLGDQSRLVDADAEKLRRMLAVNVEAVTELTHHLVTTMVERRRGGVLNVGSSLGLLWAPGMAAYVGSKYYVNGLTESLRAEVSEDGVVVSQVCPGPVATEFHDVAENTTGQRAPAWLAITADQCAREALRGFERGRARIVPGFAMRNTLRASRLLPAPVWRWMAIRLVRAMRRGSPP